MTERETFSPEIIHEDYPVATKLWQYSISRHLSRDELDSITEGTGVTIHTSKPESYNLGYGSDIYLGRDEVSESENPFPRASIEITRRLTDKYELVEGVDVFLTLVAKPSDEYSLSLDLWEADRARIEAAVNSLGGERTL